VNSLSPCFFPSVGAVKLGPLIRQHLFRKPVLLPALPEQLQGEVGRGIVLYPGPRNESRVIVEESEQPLVIIRELEICLPEAV
jgi:hypothetical protein